MRYSHIEKDIFSNLMEGMPASELQFYVKIGDLTQESFDKLVNLANHPSARRIWNDKAVSGTKIVIKTAEEKEINLLLSQEKGY